MGVSIKWREKMRIGELIGSSLVVGFMTFIVIYILALVVVFLITFPFIFSITISILVFMTLIWIGYEYNK